MSLASRISLYYRFSYKCRSLSFPVRCSPVFLIGQLSLTHPENNDYLWPGGWIARGGSEVSHLLSEIRATRRPGLFGGGLPFARRREHTHRARHRGTGRPIQPAAVSGRVNAQSARRLSPRLSGFDAVTYTQKWRRCCGIVFIDCFYPVSALYEASDIIYRSKSPPPPLSPIKNCALFCLRFLSSIFSNDSPCTRGRENIVFRPPALCNFRCAQTMFIKSWKNF